MISFSKLSVIKWTPRILSLFFVGFLSLFALDVFSDYSGWASLLPFLIHLIPSFIALFFVFVSWKSDILGAVTFALLGIGYIFMVGLNRHWSWYVGISGPAFFVALLFFISFWQSRGTMRFRKLAF